MEEISTLTKKFDADIMKLSLETMRQLAEVDHHKGTV